MDGQIDLIRAEPFRLGGHTVRPASCDILSVHGRVVLQRRVMQVLVAMARRPGAVLSREDLISQCWDGRAVGDDAVHRSMAILRRLSAQLGGFSIETIKRVGYSLTSAEPDPLTSAPALRGDAIPTIAVLPFVNISSDPEQGYFADGLTEEFICQLSQLSGARVAGRTSAFALKGLGGDVRDIGRELGVAYVLEGSVRRAGDRLRIAARLVDCVQGFDLWSETFDRRVGDVFAIQEEIAEAVCRATRATLGIGDVRPDYGGTKSFEAYDHFLKAGRVWHHLEPEEIDARAAHLRQALGIDPGFGLGWATLACLLTHRRRSLPASEYARVDEEKAQAAQRARELAPGLPEAHIAQGCVETDKRNWLAADEHCMLGVPRGPGHRPQAEHLVAGLLAATGRSREGLRYRLASRDYDPLSIGFSELVLASYLALQAWPEFEAEYARSRDLEGQRSGVERLRLSQLFAAGAGNQAIEAQYRRILERPALPLYGELAAAHGTETRVREVLERWCGLPEPAVVYNAGHLAGAYGQDDLALAALQYAVPRGFSGMIQFSWYPAFHAVRRTPAFKALMHDVGLVEFWRRSGKWPDRGRPLGEDDVEFFA
jgi:TolB-like protein